MWQAISTLLRDWHTEDAEIELKTELPGGEIHSAWHLRFGGKDYFVKCDERELLPIFTAESDQLELLSRSKTVRVPQVFAVGSDRDYSFVVMEYLPPRPLDAHNAFLLGQQLALSLIHIYSSLFSLFDSFSQTHNTPVSYTHLDVYKRQSWWRSCSLPLKRKFRQKRKRPRCGLFN